MRFLWCVFVLSSCVAAENPIFYFLDTTVASFNAMTHDKAGNIYIAGKATSWQFPATAGAYQTQYHQGECFNYSVESPCGDAFVMKLDPAGKLIFATLLGGTGNDSATAIALDPEGYIYITGITTHLIGEQNSFPVTHYALFPQPGPDVNLGGIGYSIDGFLAIFSPDGRHLAYSTYLPSLATPSLAVDSERNIYVAGNTDVAHATIHTTPGAFQPKPSVSSGQTALLLKFKAGGTVLFYATYLGDSYVQGQQAIAADSAGNLYVTGSTAAGFPVTPAAFQTNFPSTQQGSGFVAKLNRRGTELIYATYLGTNGCTYPTALKLTSNGDVWVSGWSCSGDFPTTAGSLPVSSPVPTTGLTFLTKFNSQGSALLFSTLVPDSSSDEFQGVALDVDAAGRVYLLSPAMDGFPVTAGAFQACTSGSLDLLATQFDPDGQLTGGSYLGGSGFGSVGPILAAGGGSVYISSQAQVLKILIDNPKREDQPCDGMSTER